MFIEYAEKVIGGRVDNLAREGDDVTVIGGDFIADSNGKVLYSYMSREQYDRPEVDDLVTFLRSL